MKIFWFIILRYFLSSRMTNSKLNFASSVTPSAAESSSLRKSNIHCKLFSPTHKTTTQCLANAVYWARKKNFLDRELCTWWCFFKIFHKSATSYWKVKSFCCCIHCRQWRSLLLLAGITIVMMTILWVSREERDHCVLHTEPREDTNFCRFISEASRSF